MLKTSESHRQPIKNAPYNIWLAIKRDNCLILEIRVHTISTQLKILIMINRVYPLPRKRDVSVSCRRQKLTLDKERFLQLPRKVINSSELLTATHFYPEALVEHVWIEKLWVPQRLLHETQRSRYVKHDVFFQDFYVHFRLYIWVGEIIAAYWKSFDHELVL